MQQASSPGATQRTQSTVKQILSTVDLRTLVPKTELAGAGVRYVSMRCVLHHDTKPSMSVFADGAYCYACGKQISPETFVEKVYKVTDPADVQQLVDNLQVGGTFTTGEYEPQVQTPDQGLAQMFHQQLNDQAIEYYFSRGITLDSIEKYQLGWGKLNAYCPEGYTIPIYTKNSHDTYPTLRQVKLRVAEAVDSNRYRSLTGCGTWLYLAEDTQWQDRVIIVEGEFDAILLRQLGYCATTPTGGAGTFKPNWLNLLKGSTIYCGYDADQAGDEGWYKLERLLDKPLRRIYWKQTEHDPVKDPTDTFLSHGAEYIDHCIKTANEKFITRTTLWRYR